MQSMNHIVLVSGLPRSGTSLMMQMLHAGGMPVLTDERRPPDLANPRGYFEFEAVKHTRQNAAWIQQAAGKAVKVIYRLLYDLPEDQPLRVIFMRRNLSQVVASQQAMLGRPPGSVAENHRLITIFQRELAQLDGWLTTRPQISVLNVAHERLMAHPEVVVKEIGTFLTQSLDLTAMQKAIQPALYRQRHI